MCTVFTSCLSVCIFTSAHSGVITTFPRQAHPRPGDPSESVRLCSGSYPVTAGVRTRELPEHCLPSQQCDEVPSQLLLKRTGRFIYIYIFVCECVCLLLCDGRTDGTASGARMLNSLTNAPFYSVHLISCFSILHKITQFRSIFFQINCV